MSVEMCSIKYIKIQLISIQISQDKINILVKFFKVTKTKSLDI